MTIRNLVKLLLPPIIPKLYRGATSSGKKIKFTKGGNPKQQDLEMYYDEHFANILETWGEKNAWREIQLIMGACSGKVLDVACGTGVNIKDLQKFPQLEVHGFDISELLIKRAIQKGIDPARLKVTDATNTTYSDDEFDYSYSIGSLEHFTESGIELFMAENARYTAKVSFHQIPLSFSGRDEGWVKYIQSYFNNSESWWMEKFNRHFSKTVAIRSSWEDQGVSVGMWFICYK